MCRKINFWFDGFFERKKKLVWNVILLKKLHLIWSLWSHEMVGCWELIQLIVGITNEGETSPHCRHMLLYSFIYSTY